MSEHYAPDKAVDGTLLVRENVGDIKRFTAVPGMCAAYPDGVYKPDDRENVLARLSWQTGDLFFTTAVQEIKAREFKRRDVQWYQENVLDRLMSEVDEQGKPLLSTGEEGGYDDRKFRQHSVTMEGSTLQTTLGRSHYGEFMADLNRKPEHNSFLRNFGETYFSDEWAFHSRCPGVAVLVISADGSAYVGERVAGQDRSGELNSVGGHLTYHDDPEQLDLVLEAYREMSEELGIKPEEVASLTFVGGYFDPSREASTDFTFLGHTKLPDSYFESGKWMERVKEREHGKRLIKIASMEDVAGALQAFQMICSTEGALRSLRADDLKG
jgi:8-oxo-dGTP pyrophosphatase MutT (NUDIX family)